MAAPKERAPASIYVPTGDAVTGPPRLGKRRDIGTRQPVLWRWPMTMLARRAVVRDWRRIAMHVVNEARLSFRLIAVLPDCIIWSTGEIWASNDRLAFESGGCSEKTIQRDVQSLAALGLLAIAYGWRRDASGRFAQTRSMRLALPADFSGPVPSSFQPDQMDHACPPDEAHQMDHACPAEMDTRGPVTVERSDRSEADDAS